MALTIHISTHELAELIAAMTDVLKSIKTKTEQRDDKVHVHVFVEKPKLENLKEILEKAISQTS